MNTTPPTTAQHLLDLIFENHTIRYSLDEQGNPWFVRNDIAEALKIVDRKKSINHLLDPDELGATKVTTRSVNGTVQTRSLTTLSESGVLVLVCASRKPAARRFRRWLTGEVIPQLIRYGSYIPGSTPAERCKNLYHRWKTERAEEVQNGSVELAASGLLTIGQFMKLENLPLRDVLTFSNNVRRTARAFGHQPARFYINGRMTPAWDTITLETAAAKHQPTLF